MGKTATLGKTEVFDRAAFDEMARRVRYGIMEMFAAIGHGHVGGSMSLVEILMTLYYRFMNVRPEDPKWPDRDRFVLSKGHGGPALYAVLAMKGFFPWEELLTLNQNGTRLPSHCDRTLTPGVDMTVGSLGQGLSAAVGMAYGLRVQSKTSRVYAVIGDGEANEGQIWEAAMAATKFKLDNLIAVMDCNLLQLDGQTEHIMPLQPLVEKWRAFGWQVYEADGHEWESLYANLSAAKCGKGKPSMVIAYTIKGKGVSFAEGDTYWHAGAPTQKQFEVAFKDLSPDVYYQRLKGGRTNG